MHAFLDEAQATEVYEMYYIELATRRFGSMTFATIALQNGVDIKTVSGMPGHFSAGFTLDTYAHVTISAQTESAATMEAILSPE